MKRARWASGAVTLMTLLALPGCSFLFMDRVPDDYAERSDFTCTTNRAAPGMDVLAGVTFASLGLLWLSFSRAFDTEDHNAEIALIFFSPAAITGASAVVGFSQAGDCEHAIDDLERRAQERRANAASAPASGNVTEPAACTFDTQCSGARLCVTHRCVDPPAVPAAMPMPTPQNPPAAVAP